MRQSLAGGSIYSSGRAPQHTTTSISTPMVCMTLFQLWIIYVPDRWSTSVVKAKLAQIDKNKQTFLKKLVDI